MIIRPASTDDPVISGGISALVSHREKEREGEKWQHNDSGPCSSPCPACPAPRTPPERRWLSVVAARLSMPLSTATGFRCRGGSSPTASVRTSPTADPGARTAARACASIGRGVSFGRCRRRCLAVARPRRGAAEGLGELPFERVIEDSELRRTAGRCSAGRASSSPSSSARSRRQIWVDHTGSRGFGDGDLEVVLPDPARHHQSRRAAVAGERARSCRRSSTRPYWSGPGPSQPCRAGPPAHRDPRRHHSSHRPPDQPLTAPPASVAEPWARRRRGSSLPDQAARGWRRRVTAKIAMSSSCSPSVQRSTSLVRASTSASGSLNRLRMRPEETGS